MSEEGLQNLKVKINREQKIVIEMKLSELRMERQKLVLSRLALPTMGTRNEFHRLLSEELLNRGIDVDTYDFKDEEKHELQTTSISKGIDMSSVLGTRSFQSRNSKFARSL